MNKAGILFIIFIIYVFIIFSSHNYEYIKLWDEKIISYIQNVLSSIPVLIPLLPDLYLYSIMILIFLSCGGFYFFKQKEYKKLILFITIPIVAYIVNCILKNLFKRPRPIYELQLYVHPKSYSFPSSHTLITTALFGISIFLINKHIKNKLLKMILIIFCILWILFVGFSRIWLGVHNPTDILGAYLAGFIIILIYKHCF